MTARMDRGFVETLVIGGGQAGLATGYHLGLAGIEHLILEKSDDLGDVWRQRWDSLSLFTPGRYNSLPGMPYPGPAGSYPTKDQIADYLADYAARFGLPVRTGARVERLSRRDGRFEVILAGETLSADSVVVATGSYHTPRVPQYAAQLDRRIVQMHSSEYRRPSQANDGPVLVVGAGNSGSEISLDLAADHQTWLSGSNVGHEPTRPGTLPDRLLTPIIWFMASRVLSVSNPIGRKARDLFLHPPRGIPLGRVRDRDLSVAGVERVPRVAGVKDGRPLLEDGRVLDVSTVIWCTGFRPGFEWIDLPIFDDFGWPVNHWGVVSSTPGLYFMGLLFQHTLSSALVGGVGRDAAHVVGDIARRARTGGGRRDGETARR